MAGVMVPRHPGVFSAIGLLSTDLVHYDSRSAYVVLGPDSVGQVEAVFAEMEEQLRRRIGPAAEGLPVQRTLDARLLGQGWETPFIEVPEGPVSEDTLTELLRRLTG